VADPARAERARALREHGSRQRYYHDEIGYNYRMEGIQGAVLGVKLRHLAAWTAARRRIARKYADLLRGTPLKLQSELPGTEGVWHLFVVRHPRREELKAFLEQHGIGAALHYPVPLHLQKCYADLGYKAGDLPVAEAAARECLSLPIYPELTDSQVEYVAQQVRAFFTA
jgi:dTDP-4-amino-4,6-dideoxygalactose transaminase